MSPRGSNKYGAVVIQDPRRTSVSSIGSTSFSTNTSHTSSSGGSSSGSATGSYRDPNGSRDTAIGTAERTNRNGKDVVVVNW
ncbi:hypothetical protein MAPG_07652 [Magnaporthiopsis poae ATCC 64411]|uniref:Uncharacterized protein n=1 Tax=Magnaporthiopsis poae (strain ATCC 64411 / 73-15) TaxID=644358 RepID=A0A0C4E586_MAGP6|nr:hypothetical protein MAPG_07652 [Magnaporthiopsis poae ATCC 64411]